MTVYELESYSPYGFYNTRDQLRTAIYKQSEKAASIGNTLRDQIKSKDDLKERKDFIRNKLIESLGGLPSFDTPLNPNITGIVECDGFRIEKIILEPRPNVYMTANLYVPDGIKHPTGAVLFLCGHHERAKHEPEYQIVCNYLVKAGLVVLAQDPVGQGERFSYYEKSTKDTTVTWGIYEHDHAGMQCWPLGDASARYFLHDAMRGIDYLRSRPEVDPNKIGVTGNSGGGTQTALMMICDPRIAAAAPATFITDRIAHMYTGGPADAEHIWPGMSVYGFDHEDMLIPMAPKPVLVLAVKSDFFPIEGTRNTVNRAEKAWDIYDKTENLALFEDNTTHKYTPKMAKAAAVFFSKHLNSKAHVPTEKNVEPMEPSKLWCTVSGQIRGELEDARFIYEENCIRLEEIEEKRKIIPYNQQMEQGLKWLEEEVLYNRKPCDFNYRELVSSKIDELTVQTYMWWSQEGIFNYGILFRKYNTGKEKLPVTIAIWDGGTTQIEPHMKWIEEVCGSERAVMVVDTSGVGNIMPNSMRPTNPLDFYGVIFTFLNDFMWLGDSIAALRTFDVTRAIEVAPLLPGVTEEDIQLYAYGRQGVYAQLAAAIDNKIKYIDVVEGLGSYRQFVTSRHYDSYDIASVIFPGILKHLDLPDIMRWIKERNK